MKKLSLIAFGLLVSLSVSANYPSLEFKHTDGTSTLFDAQGLAVTVDGSDIVVTAAGGYDTRFDAASLLSMQFSESEAGVNSALAPLPEGSVEVYTPDGKFVGTFSDYAAARASLATGLYVFKTTEGKTVKIFTGK